VPAVHRKLNIAPCSFAAARFAVVNWHYSRSMPVGKLVKFGVWERGEYIGCILYGRGATGNIGKPFKLKQTEICELVRVALKQHEAPVSKMLSISLRQIKRLNPGLRLIISYADPQQGHHGGIYQASNWLYLGALNEGCYFRVLGQIVHPKTLHGRYGAGGQSIVWLRKNVDPKACIITKEAKHKYVYPLDAKMRAELITTIKQYPARKVSDDRDQRHSGGVAPTYALQT